MATHSGVEGLVTIAGNTVAEIKGFSIEESVNTLDDSSLTDTSATHLAGRASWTATIECMWDETDSTGQEAMTIGASLAAVFKPEGATTGDANMSGTATITGRSIAVADESIITQSFSLTGNGALTHGTE